MKRELSCNGFEVAVVAPDQARRLAPRPALHGQGNSNMPGTHPSTQVAQQNSSAAHETSTNHPGEPHPAPLERSYPSTLTFNALKPLSASHQGERSRRLVFMSFDRERGWRCRFCNADRTVILRQIVFRSADKILETARRGHGLTNDIDRLCLEQEIATGRGGVWLKLTEEQYKSLCRREPQGLRRCESTNP